MIGKFIKSFHHIMRYGENSTPINVLCIRNTSVIKGEIIYAKHRSGKDALLFFQNAHATISCEDALQSFPNVNQQVVRTAFNKWRNCTILTRWSDMRHYATQIIMIPSDFDAMYQQFTQQNRRLLQPIFSRLVGIDNDLSKAVFAITNNANLFVWAIKAITQHRSSIMTIYRVMLWKDTYPQLTNKLKRGAIPSYNSFTSIIELMKEARQLRSKKRLNDIVNSFNTEQKKILKNSIDILPIPIFNKFAVLSYKKRHNFIRKVSNITDINEIIRLMSFVISSHFEWTKESLMSYLTNVENLNYKLVLATDTSVLVQVNDYETIKKLAKTTNWCISKNKTYWNNYIREGKETAQYVLFDFSQKEDSELSIVGFTTNGNNGITHAHSFTNNNLMGSARNDNNTYISVLGEERKKQNNIYSVIANNNIPLSLVTKFKSHFPQWTKDEFIKTFDKYFGKDNYSFYLLNDDKVVISTRYFNGIYSLLGHSGYSSAFCDAYDNCEHIFFADFSKDVTDDKRLLFAIVVESSYNSAYKTAIGMYNEYSIKTKYIFNKILDEYGLPYDIICRPNTLMNKFAEALISKDVESINEYLKMKEVKDFLVNKRCNDIKNLIIRHLSSSIQEYTSTQLIDAFIDNGYDLSLFINYTNLAKIINNLYGECTSLPISITSIQEFNEIISKIDNKNVGNTNAYQRALYGKAYIINKLLTIYSDNKKALSIIYPILLEGMCNYRYSHALTDKIIIQGMDYLDFNNVSLTCVRTISTIFQRNISEAIDKLFTLDITNKLMQTTIADYAPHKFQDKIKKLWGVMPKKEEKDLEVKTYSTSNLTWTSIGSSFTFAAAPYFANGH